MGNKTSRPPKEVKYSLVLDASGSIKHTPGKPNVDYESADNVLHLEVHDWRESSRSFHLGIETETPKTDFDYRVDWNKDVLHFSFQLHRDYLGGRPELLRRMQRLLLDDNILGVTQKYLGRKTMADVLTEMRKSHHTRSNWRPVAVRYGCSTTWLKRKEGARLAFYKVVVDDEETVMLAVDTTNEEYKDAVGGKPEKFLQMLTIPVRVWMAVMLTKTRKRPKEEEKSTLIEPVSEEEDTTSELEKLVRYLETGTVEQASEHLLEQEGIPNKDEIALEDKESCEKNLDEDGEPTDTAVKDVMSNQSTERTPGALKRIARKKQNKREKRKKEKRKMANKKPKKVRPASQDAIDDVSDAANSESVALTNASSTITDPASFTSAPLSPPSSPSCPSDLLQSIEHQAPAVYESQGPRPVLLASTSRLTIISVDQAQSEEPAADTKSCPGQQKGGQVPALPVSPDEESQSAAIQDQESATSPQKETSTRSERESPSPASNPTFVFRGSAAVLIPSLPESSDEDNDSSSGDSEATIRPSSEPVTPMAGKKKSHRKKRTRANTRKRLAAEKGLLEAQDPLIQDDGTRQRDVEVQDPAVTDAPSQHDSQATHAEPSPSKLTTSPSEKPAKQDKGKGRASDVSTLDTAFSSLDISQSFIGADFQFRPKDTPSSNEGVATARASPFYRQPSPEPNLPGADVEFWLPVRPVTDPEMGDSSKSAAIRATTPGFDTAAPAGPAFRGSSSYITPATTPSFKAEVPAGPKDRDASSSRLTTATTPGASTEVPAGPEEGGFVQGANPAMTLGPETVAPAGPSQGGLPATPASINDRSAQPSRTHAPGPTTDIHAPDGTKVMVLKKPANFFYDLTYHSFECLKEGCGKRCMLWDGRSVVCPACGPYSAGTYCCKEHMREDVKSHWQFCGQLVFEHPCKKLSIPPNSLVGPPQIPSVHNWSTPEHYRQAMWFCTAGREGDYFIFSDWSDQTSARITPGHVDWRCQPRVLFTVTFTNEAEKDRFRRILAVCLLAALEVQPLVDYMFRLIRDWFRRQDQWSESMDAMLRYQFYYELGVELPPDITGERHACECEWTGQNRRRCRDETCVSERHALLGDWAWGRGFQRLCDIMEANHWLLRAHRTTHPTVRDGEARTRGDGFAEVLEEDQRLFSRGAGWDGFDSEPMEIEESLAGVVYDPSRPYPR